MLVETRGQTLRCAGGYLATLDPEIRKRVEARLSTEVRVALQDARIDEWYPYDIAKATYDAIIAAHDSPADARRALYDLGRWSADATANSFLRLFLKIMSPGLFAKKLTQLLSKDFRGFPGGAPDVVYDLSKESSGEIVVELRNAGNHPYLGVGAIGYIEFAFEHMGKKGVKVEERDCDMNDYGASFARWYISWTP